VTSTSKVESTHTTNDFHKLTWELVEGEVVESRIDNVSGAFATEAVLISSSKTDIVGSSNLDLSGSSISTTTLTTEQSGMYGSSGSSVSSSKVSSKTVAETLTKFSTDSESKTAYDGWSQTTDYETSSSTITEFSSSESFSDKDGDKASWSSSYDYESDWSYDYDYTNGGYAISLSDSGGDSWSESSGEQTYTPPEEGNPNNNYNGRVRTFGGGHKETRRRLSKLIDARKPTLRNSSPLLAILYTYLQKFFSIHLKLTCMA
jgi:hypothetical protein